MNDHGIEVLAVSRGSDKMHGFPQLRYGEVDINGIKRSVHRAEHYRTWEDGYCPYCDVEDIQSAWVLYADVTSRGILIDAPAPPAGVEAALKIARTHL